MRRLTTAALLLALAGCAAGTPASQADWATYGGSGSRAGVAPGAPANPGLQRRFARTVDGQVYAQPLIADGRIFIATENNSVYAFSTSGRQIWKRHLGRPVDGGSLPCGNIDPSGITGTPVIAHGRLFAAAYLANGHHHVLYGLSTKSGRVVVRRNIDPPDRIVHQQRGALLAAHGRIYVPYGGLAGDCGPYHGRIVSVTESGRRRIAYKTPSQEAGIWTPGGIAAQSGTILATTGNGVGSSFGDQNAVLRLSLGLRRRAYWAPKNWRSLSASDTDVNSIQPLPVSGGNVFQIGKEGVGHLLPQSLGGVGGELFSGRVCGNAAFGASGFRAPLAIVPCGDALFGLRIGANRFSIAWRNGAGGRVPVIAGNSIFAITNGGRLNQFRFSDGKLLASRDIGGGDTSFPAAAASGRTLVAPSARGFVVFRL